ncbi:MAG: hypothetical protein U0271_41005 [Polyangiaceae bacterium]
MASPQRLLLVGATVLASTGCLFPDYTFDEKGGGGSGATTSSTGGQPSGGGGAGGSTTSTGGMPNGGNGGTGGGPIVEDCFTPGDEDANGSADCGDPACGVDLECVDPIPVGWGTFGYAAVFHGSMGQDPACPDGTTMEVYGGNDGLTNTTATCSACGCGTPAWTDCEFLSGDIATGGSDYDPVKPGIQPIRVRDAACGVGATNFITLTVPSAWDGTCTTGADEAPPGLTNCPGGVCNQSVEVAAAKPTGGTCNTTGGAPTGPTPTWTQAVKACRAETGLTGCSGGQTCVPRPATPYVDRICIGKAGDQTCPGVFTDKVTSFGAIDDSRDCTACSCNAATGGSCKLTVGVYADNLTDTCATQDTTIESGKCSTLTSNPRVKGRNATLMTAPAGGSCTVAGGGTPTGAVAAASETTFCCLPPE